MMAVFIPFLAAAMAAHIPARPAPTTQNSTHIFFFAAIIYFSFALRSGKTSSHYTAVSFGGTRHQNLPQDKKFPLYDNINRDNISHKGTMSTGFSRFEKAN
jgi:hypothetical protein